MRRLAVLGWFALAMAAPAAGQQAAPAAAQQTAVATFAAGCFWCVESDFDKVDGVLETVSGYAGGKVKNPTYQQVSAGGTGHTEVVRITYDPARVTYQQLLDVFWRNVDPLAKDAQFCDHGDQYRSAIFTHGEEQKALAEASRKAVQAKFKEPVQTQIAAAGEFYPAEDYHQDYYRKNPIRYGFYRFNCGRDARLEQLWGRQ